MTASGFNRGVSGSVSERSVKRAALHARTSFGADVARLRADAGLPRTVLARAAGIDQSHLARIELGIADPSAEVCARIALALGADLSHRLYPNTGPTVRDRHQAAIAEAVLATIHPRWHPILEIGVRSPARGWIDVGLHDARTGVLLATEIQSDLRRLEQLIRWSTSKAESLSSWEGYARLGDVTVSQLLIVRDSRTTRRVALEFRHLLRSAYPADPRDALESLTGAPAWPGPALLWAAARRVDSRSYRLVARP